LLAVFVLPRQKALAMANSLFLREAGASTRIAGAKFRRDISIFSNCVDSLVQNVENTIC